MRDILTVTALNEAIRNLLEESFDLMWVEGEVSNLRRPASGHAYFTLKDDKSQIRAVIFRSPFGQRPLSPAGVRGFELEEGLHVICRARLSVYQPRGEYQLIVDAIEPQGLGALQKAFEQLKARLEAEGLFAAAHKQPIPFIPRRVGVITSPTGAVIRDIINVSGRRFPAAGLLIAPVRVQGTEAPGEIIQAISDLNQVGGVDVIILARGGGSLEDLAPFNDERVARAIHRSRIPIISAIGHETDFTIADFVADLRAPTPSAAAELAVPDCQELSDTVDDLCGRLVRGRRQNADRLRERVITLQERLRDPGRILADMRITLDDRMDRLRSALNTRVTFSTQRRQYLQERLQRATPVIRIGEGRRFLTHLEKEMIGQIRRIVERLRAHVDTNMAFLESLGPLSVLQRGYSITRTHPAGAVIKDTTALHAGMDVRIQVWRGAFQAKITRIDGE